MAWILTTDSSHYLFKWRGLSLQVFEHPTFFMQYELLYQLCLERIKYVYSFALNIGTYIPDVDVKRSLFVYILLKSISLAWWYHIYRLKAAKCKPYFGSYNHRARGSVSCHNVKSWIFSLIFSSPKLKAQLSFSDCLLPVCKKFNIVIIFSITTGPISNKLGSKHPCEKGFKFVQMKSHALFQKEKWNSLIIFKNLLFQWLSVCCFFKQAGWLSSSVIIVLSQTEPKY